MKKLISLLLLSVLIFSLTSYGEIKAIAPLEWGFLNRDIDNYEKKRADVGHAADYMPSLDALFGYTEISYAYQYTSLTFFESRSMVLFVEYPDDVYEEKKTEALASYDFLEKTLISEGGKSYQSAPAEFEYGGYDLRTSVRLINNSACKSFAFIGSDDDKGRIVYCYYYDFDLDTLGSTARTEQEVITDFIDDFFDWNDLP